MTGSTSELGDLGVPGHAVPDPLARAAAGSRSRRSMPTSTTAIGPVDEHLGRPRMGGAHDDGLATADRSRPRPRPAARSRGRCGRARGDARTSRPGCPAAAPSAARAGGRRPAGRARRRRRRVAAAVAGWRAASGRVGRHRPAVEQPDLVVARRAVVVSPRRDPRLPRMAQPDLVLQGLLAPRRVASLVDDHAQSADAQLGLGARSGRAPRCSAPPPAG